MTTVQTQGYQIIEKIFTPEEITQLRNEADQVAKTAKTTCVRSLHQKSALFKNLPNHPALKPYLPPDPICVRTILFDKTPESNWPVAWHQDLTIAVQEKIETQNYGPWSTKDNTPHVQPPTELLQKIITIRIHLDPTDESNGALKVIPKSHKNGKLPTNQIPEITTNTTPTTCTANPGDILLMSPLILHASERSTNPTRRRIIHLEFAQKNTLHKNLTWNKT